MENKNVPAIRFKGFTDDWEQRKVGDLLIERNEQAPKSDEYPLMAFIANEGVAPKGERYDRSALVTDTVNKFYKKTEIGDFIYSSNNLETGSIGLNKYGKACISPVYSIFESTDIADSDFLGRRLVRKDFINAMVKWRQGVIYGQWRIHESDFLKIEIPVPVVEEQRKIGAYLDNLDHLITLHQRKYDKLVKIKKSMLEKLFPKNGKSVPEIRFEGFTDDWEQRKLGEISSLITKGSTPKDKSGNGEVNFIKVENIDDFSGEIMGTSKISLKEHQGYLKRSQLQEGEILFSIAGTLGRVTSVSKGILPANTNQALSIIRLKEGNLEYIKTCLKGKVVADFIRRNPTIGAQPNLSLEQVSTLAIGMPSETEQEKIGKYFSTLDHLITLHQRKIEKMKNIKKSMLDNMFPDEK